MEKLRNLFWKTKDGQKIKIKDLETNHLENIPGHIKKNMAAYESSYGKEKTKLFIKAVNKEIRLRKINRIRTNPDYSDLF